MMDGKTNDADSLTGVERAVLEILGDGNICAEHFREVVSGRIGRAVHWPELDETLASLIKKGRVVYDYQRGPHERN